jgi:hypothetical protein
VQVDWEFWTNSNDMCGAVCDVQREFIKVRILPVTFINLRAGGRCLMIPSSLECFYKLCAGVQELKGYCDAC